MLNALEGFTTIALVVTTGWLLARFRAVRHSAQPALQDVAYFVGQPALVLVAISGAELDVLFGWHVVAFGLSCVMVGLAFALLSKRRWGARRGEAVIAYLTTSYVNAGNLGIPLASFLLGDPAWAAPAILLQVLLLQPTAIAVLESSAAGRGRSVLRSFLTHPLVLGGFVGLIVNLSGWRPPSLLWSPINVLADIGIPTMLLAFGMSLHSSPMPRLDRLGGQTLTAIATKVLVVPTVALGLGLAFGLSGTALRAAVLLAALPTAQIVFVHASRYRVSEKLVQGVTLWSTLLCIPVVAAAALAG